LYPLKPFDFAVWKFIQKRVAIIEPGS